MSDYLGNIAKCNLGLAEVILPRVASRFEPLPFGEPPITQPWSRNDEAISSLSSLLPSFNESGPVDHREGIELLNPQRTISSPKSPKGKTEDIQVRSTAITIQDEFARPEESAKSLQKIPDDRPMNHKTSKAQPSSPLTSLPIKPSLETSLSAAESSEINEHRKPVSSYTNRHIAVEPGDLANSPEYTNHRDTRVEDETHFPLKPAVGYTVIEKTISEPRSIFVRDEEFPSARFIKEESKGSAKISPVQLIEIEQNSEARSKRPVRHLSEPISTKVTQPLTLKTGPEDHYAKYFRRTDARLIEPKSMRKPEPDIQVTIGRIEVRATPLPARAKSERRTPPVMSLEDYLHSRGGGK